MAFRIPSSMSHESQVIPLAHAARTVHRLGLQAAARGLRGARTDGVGGAGSES